MSKIIFVAAPDGARTEYTEQHLKNLWEQGLLKPDSLYWTEGMSEWRSLREYFPEGQYYVAPVSSQPFQDIGNSKPVFEYSTTRTFIKDPRGLTKVLVGMLWIGIVLDVIAIASSFLQVQLLSSTFTDAQAEENDAREGLVGVVQLGLYLVTAITFLTWTHRAYRNSQGFASQPLRFSPGWAVGSFFVPFLNLVRPYQCMKEIWQVSQNPTNHSSVSASVLLRSWWFLWLVGGFLGQIEFRLAASSTSVDALRSLTVFSIFTALISLVLTLVVILLLKKILQGQEKLVSGDR